MGGSDLFLSFVPYVGLVLAVAPAVLLALAEFGLGRAIVVIVAVVVVNVLAEYVLSPVLMGRGPGSSSQPERSASRRARTE